MAKEDCGLAVQGLGLVQLFDVLLGKFEDIGRNV